MSTTETGRNAEEKVAEFLRREGHKIIAKNWRTRWCEIDIVSTYKNTVFFTEVKYRRQNDWGSGFDYITKAKLKQMTFAADIWIHDNKWRGECVLQGASIDDQSVEIVEIFS